MPLTCTYNQQSERVNHCTCFLIIRKVMFKCAESAPIEVGEIILVYELEAIHYFQQQNVCYEQCNVYKYSDFTIR